VYQDIKGDRFGASVTFRYVVLDAEKDAAEAWDVKYGQPLFQYGAGLQGWQ
jgi:hypothetical protein